MLINDTDALARQRRLGEMEIVDDQMLAWIRNELMFSECIDDPDTSPLLTMKKIGTPMIHSEMERRLKKLNPNLTFEWSGVCIGVSQAKVAKLLMPDGTKRTIFTYDSGMMPERSTWRSVTKWLPDPFYKPNRFDEDIKDWEVKPRSDDDIAELMDGLGIPYVRSTEGSNPSWSEVKDTNHWWLYFELVRKDENSGRAGWIKEVVPVGESVRGYRTCALMCVAAGVITAQQAEKAFGSDNTPEWKQHTGKGPITRPW